MLFRLVHLPHTLIQTGTFAPAWSLIGSDPLFAWLPLPHVASLGLAQAPFRPPVVLIINHLLRHMLDIVPTHAAIGILFLITLHVSEARIQVVVALLSLVTNQHRHSGACCWRCLLLLLSLISPCKVLVSV